MLEAIKERESTIWDIESEIKGIGSLYEKYATVYAAYLVKTRGLNSRDSFIEMVRDSMKEDRWMFLSSAVDKNWDTITHLSESVDERKLLIYLKYYTADASTFTGFYATPESEAVLAGKLLDVQDDDSIADICCGFGTFLQVTNDIAPESRYYGVELIAQAKEITLIKSELFGRTSRVDCRDMFAIDDSLSFDKIFTDPPLGMKPMSYRYQNTGLDNVMASIAGMEKATSYTWPIASLIMNHLKENGIAVELVAMGGLFNSVEKEIRKYFVENHYIKGVIALPRRLTTAHGVQTAFVIFSREKKSEVRMIDARELYVSGRRQNTLSDENIADILNGLTEDCDYAKSVPIEKIRENDYALNPERYFQKQITIENGVELGSVVRTITRGAPLRASQLDEMVSNAPTDIQYLMLSNIQNGIINSELPYLKALDKKYEKFIIQNGDIILSKTGAPFKSAVANFLEGRKVIGSGNLYIIRVDENKLNPYFLKAFLESEAGTASLQQASAGAMLANISLDALRSMVIPVPPMEKQSKIADEYRVKEDAVKVLTRRLEKAQSEMKEVYREEDADAVD